MTEEELRKRQEKARAMRYKKPIVRGLNLEEMTDALCEMESECADIEWAAGSEEILVTMLGNEEEASEFKFMFSGLANDCGIMLADLQQEYVPECFDRFLAAINPEREILWGFDSEEGDYFGMPGYETEKAMEEAAKQLKRLTKDQLVDAAQRCFSIAFGFIGLQQRYESLKATLDILNGKENGRMKVVKDLNELYEKSYGKRRFGEYDRDEYTEKFDHLLEAIDPSDALWVS